jgi:membrane associated rhomboid family serine protease
MDAIDVEPRRVSYALPVSRPIATWILLGIIVIVFIIETLIGGSTETDVLIRLGAKVTPLVAAGEYWRLLTAMFLHIGIVHVLFNGYALVAIGTELERILGWRRFLAIYLLSGLFGGLASYAFIASLSAGASGAIFGIIGALAAFFALVGGIALVTLVQRDSLDSHLLRAQDAIQREAWDEVVVELEQVVHQDSTLNEAYFYLGLAHNQLDQPQLAAQAYESALALEPDFPQVHWYLALTYLQLDRFAEAQTHFETYLQLSPDEVQKVQPYLDELGRIVP